MGQWTLALGVTTGTAIGVDKSIPRLMLATRWHKIMALTIVEFRLVERWRLAVGVASFDGVFCYGAFMFGRRDETLRELPAF